MQQRGGCVAERSGKDVGSAQLSVTVSGKSAGAGTAAGRFFSPAATMHPVKGYAQLCVAARQDSLPAPPSVLLSRVTKVAKKLKIQQSTASYSITWSTMKPARPLSRNPSRCRLHCGAKVPGWLAASMSVARGCSPPPAAAPVAPSTHQWSMWAVVAPPATGLALAATRSSGTRSPACPFPAQVTSRRRLAWAQRGGSGRLAGLPR